MAKQQQYRVLERIASGGMAEVFSAESAGLEGFKKKVAIKRVLPHLCEKTEFIGMFLDEARLSAHLNHSNCVQVFDIGRGDDSYFIVMELVDGADLKGIIEHRRKRNQFFPVEEACLVGVRICEGLAYAHELRDEEGEPRNIVHRDMSPPNVLITRFGEVKIVDFGLAKANSQLEDSQPGMIKGKFGYLSPESTTGQIVDARTDLFAVGIILWEMLGGRRLFKGKTDLETVRLVQRADIPDIREVNPEVPDAVWQVLQRALAADPAARYQSARQFCHDLNFVLFNMNRAVTSFDIAQLVVPVEQERESKKRRKAQTESVDSLIGSLIEEALLEFTSLGDSGGEDAGPASVSQGSVPLALDSFSAQLPLSDRSQEPDWGGSLSLDSPQSFSSEAEDSLLSHGNLSVLEDSVPAPPPSDEDATNLLSSFSNIFKKGRE